MLKAYANSRDPDALSEEEGSSYWNRPASTTFVLPPFNDEGGEHYTKNNEIADYMDAQTRPSKGNSDDKGWLSAAKSVFRGPSKVVNSLSRYVLLIH